MLIPYLRRRCLGSGDQRRGSIAIVVGLLLCVYCTETAHHLGSDYLHGLRDGHLGLRAPRRVLARNHRVRPDHGVNLVLLCVFVDVFFSFLLPFFCPFVPACEPISVHTLSTAPIDSRTRLTRSV